jgi:DNA (cytosine-5)-methyltransferase 1
MARNGKKRFASIFSGCGGFDLGFMWAGFECALALDIDPLAVAVHQNNLNSTAVVCDVSNGHLPIDSLQHLDVLLAGSPCQGFSTAGKRAFDDPRNHLLLTAGKIATIVKPRVFVAENVAGITAEPHVHYWKALERMLRQAGYRTAEFLCVGTSMGVAQIRKRAVLIAWNTEIENDITLPTVEGGTLGNVLANCSDAPNHNPKLLSRSSDQYKIARRVKPGQKLSNVRGGPRALHTWQIPEVFGKTSPSERAVLETLLRLRRRRRIRETGDADPVPTKVLEAELGKPITGLLNQLLVRGYVRKVGRLFDLSHTFNGKFRRLQLDQPSLTVDTRFGNPRYFLHPTQHRGFSVREAARIQGFPDSFVFCGSEIRQFRLVGNAVPPPLAHSLATVVKRLLPR